nr:hypothetical protein [Tanacetum cinerariifolium]
MGRFKIAKVARVNRLIEVIKKSPEEFSKASGLVTNLGKSIIFFGSINERDMFDLLQVLPFKCGKLSVRYLSVPLLAKKLGYWASVYLLPTTVINDLEKLFKKFLWNAGDSARGKAKVSWKVVCMPKDQGGLGIKSLKNGMRSIWDVNMDKSDSWGWTSILKVRDDIKNHVWYDIGNERSISMWYDRWCMDGPLCSLISRRDIYDARLYDNAKVSDMINNNQWNWPIGWKEKYVLLNNLDGAVRLSNKDDKVLWVTNAEDKVRFTTKQAWEDLRDNWPLVN